MKRTAPVAELLRSMMAQSAPRRVAQVHAKNVAREREWQRAHPRQQLSERDMHAVFVATRGTRATDDGDFVEDSPGDQVADVPPADDALATRPIDLRVTIQSTQLSEDGAEPRNWNARAAVECVLGLDHPLPGCMIARVQLHMYNGQNQRTSTDLFPPVLCTLDTYNRANAMRFGFTVEDAEWQTKHYPSGVAWAYPEAVDGGSAMVMPANEPLRYNKRAGQYAPIALGVTFTYVPQSQARALLTLEDECQRLLDRLGAATSGDQVFRTKKAELDSLIRLALRRKGSVAARVTFWGQLHRTGPTDKHPPTRRFSGRVQSETLQVLLAHEDADALISQRLQMQARGLTPPPPPQQGVDVDDNMYD